MAYFFVSLGTVWQFEIFKSTFFQSIRNLTLTRLTYVQNVVNFLDCQFYFCWVINHEKGSGLLVFFALIDRGIYGGSRPPNQVWQKSLGLHRLLGSNGHQAQVLVLQNDSFFLSAIAIFCKLVLLLWQFKFLRHSKPYSNFHVTELYFIS